MSDRDSRVSDADQHPAGQAHKTDRARYERNLRAKFRRRVKTGQTQLGYSHEEAVRWAEMWDRAERPVPDRRTCAADLVAVHAAALDLATRSLDLAARVAVLLGAFVDGEPDEAPNLHLVPAPAATAAGRPGPEQAS